MKDIKKDHRKEKEQIVSSNWNMSTDQLKIVFSLMLPREPFCNVVNLSPQIDDFQQQMSEVEQKLSQKTHEVEVMQSELKLVKEFRRKRAQMQQELEQVRSFN